MIIILPRHGIRYASKDEALADWYAGRDFRMSGGHTYCSNRDFSPNHYNIDGLVLDWDVNELPIRLEYHV